MDRRADLDRIVAALAAASELVREFDPGRIAALDGRDGEGPVTELDRALDGLLARRLPGAGEGWLSEESPDDRSRLARPRVWIVDPVDGTHELLAGIPEWCVSIALVEEGRPVAGGILNPARDETVLGAEGLGVWHNGRPARVTAAGALAGALVLASRSESARGEWDRLRQAPFRIVPTGSVAYKLAKVAAGLADATWTLRPKREWDVAGGVALVLAAGGRAWVPGNGAPGFNAPEPSIPGLAACAPGLEPEIRSTLDRLRPRSQREGRRERP